MGSRLSERSVTEPRRISTEAELNDDCSAVTITFHEVPLDELANMLTTLGHPEMVRQFVDGVNAQIPLKQAGLGETRKIFSINPGPGG